MVTFFTLSTLRPIPGMMRMTHHLTIGYQWDPVGMGKVQPGIIDLFRIYSGHMDI